jgi:BON domain-containing protein
MRDRHVPAARYSACTIDRPLPKPAAQASFRKVPTTRTNGGRASGGDLIGVRGVTNSIAAEPRVNAADVKTQIESALKRSAEIDARRINVTVTDGRVTLTGNVHFLVRA